MSVDRGAEMKLEDCLFGEAAALIGICSLPTSVCLQFTDLQLANSFIGAPFS
jgi:hypothetical protein